MNYDCLTWLRKSSIEIEEVQDIYARRPDLLKIVSPIRIAIIAVGINIPLMILLFHLIVLRTWHLGQQPYTNLLMFLGFIPLSFGIGLMTVAFEVRKQNHRQKNRSI